jgi:16S rRNA (guanine(527)-N(7))-methyltransferase RsmG
VIDLGSGAGFPGLPLKIWAPQIQLALIESNHKKAAFLREVCRALTLTGVNVIAERAEAVADRLTGSHVDVPRADVPPVDAALADLVTFRAVERFDQILPVALRFLVPRGRLALLISSDQLPRVKTDPPMRWAAINIPQSHKRILCLGDRASWII